jgi:alkanesulfonate monooxygenase SsuD/methylene tetrahydromethanopterin reductase-like flavin-dependent oxidoreductase (luciferase family)
MEFGVLLTDMPIAVSAQEHFDGILRQVEAAQRNGMSYILIGQHFVFREYRWLQPVPLLARLAAEVDPDVKLVTQVLIGPLYHPVLLAEELATLDIVSQGRLIVGLGLGYRTTEYETFGVPFKERGRRLDECIAVLKAMWTNDKVTFSGDFWHLDDVPVHIRPVQDPHPPLWIGADSRAGVMRAARLGDAWPIPPQVPVDQASRRIQAFVDERTRLGLPVGPLPIRREVVVGRDREDATDWAVRRAGPSLGHMHQMNDTGVRVARDDPTVDLVERSFVLGDLDDCTNQLQLLAAALPVNPVITRAGWPGMTSTDSVERLDSLGPLVHSLRTTAISAPVPVAGR